MAESDRPDEVLQTGEIRLNVDRRQVWVSGKEIALTRLDFNILEALMRSKGRVLTHGWLCEHVWGFPEDSQPETASRRVHVSKIRRRLGAEGRRLISVRGVGYRLNPE